MKVIICGGGIGGLAAALCCHHFGHEVILLERALGFDEIGAGIQLPPNALKVFAKLGVRDALLRVAFEPQALEARLGEGRAKGQQNQTTQSLAPQKQDLQGWVPQQQNRRKPLFSIPVQEAAQARWGERYLHIHRADYIRVLENELCMRAPGALRLAHEVMHYTQKSSGVTAICRDGQVVEGDILVAMDGIHSTIRAQLLGADRPRYTGNVAWRCVVPIEKLGEHAPPPTACVWMGRGRHAVTYRLRAGSLANFVGVVETPDWHSESWMQAGRKEQALVDFANWDPVITTLIETADRMFQWALLDRPPLERWGEGRVMLLGDAAHPMLPFLAQGAAMAVEDAWVLARALGMSKRDVTKDLEQIEALRKPRVTKVQAKSRANMGVFHRKTALGRLATYGPMWLMGRLAPHLIHSRMGWLYGEDVTR